jgi:type II secretory pathway pseudopilin PulG
MARPVPCAPREAGFTYVGLIVLVAIVGLVGAATLKADALLRRAAAEQELLEIGAAFSAALQSYAEATPRGQPPYPPSLQELLKDPRSPAIRRHLRKIFVDPVSGKAEWGIVYAGAGAGAVIGSGAGGNGGNAGNGGNNGGGVLAVYSLSNAKPLKVANFDARFANLENREHISDWKFAALGKGVGQPGQPGQSGQPGQPGQNGAPGAQPPPSLFPGNAVPPPTTPAPAEPPAEPPAPAEEMPAGEPPADASNGEEEREDADAADDKRARRDRQVPPSTDSR